MSGLVHALPQLARKSFSVHAVLFEVVSDHGRHALCPVEPGWNLDLPLPFLPFLWRNRMNWPS
jgi:hypothetical protein